MCVWCVYVCVWLRVSVCWVGQVCVRVRECVRLFARICAYACARLRVWTTVDVSQYRTTRRKASGELLAPPSSTPGKRCRHLEISFQFALSSNVKLPHAGLVGAPAFIAFPGARLCQALVCRVRARPRVYVNLRACVRASVHA